MGREGGHFDEEDFGREGGGGVAEGDTVFSWGWGGILYPWMVLQSIISKADAIIALAHSGFSQSSPPSLPYLFYMEISVKTCLRSNELFLCFFLFCQERRKSGTSWHPRWGRGVDVATVVARTRWLCGVDWRLPKSPINDLMPYLVQSVL